MATVADLLTQSRAAHEQFKFNSHRMIPTGVGGVIETPGNPTEARKFLAEAQRLRLEAHDLDPTHADPAWGPDQQTHPHDDVLDFYAKVLGV